MLQETNFWFHWISKASWLRKRSTRLDESIRGLLVMALCVRFGCIFFKPPLIPTQFCGMEGALQPYNKMQFRSLLRHLGARRIQFQERNAPNSCCVSIYFVFCPIFYQFRYCILLWQVNDMHVFLLPVKFDFLC